MIRYASVCSGIEAASVAWHGLGWKPQWFAEIDAFPSAVLKHRWPEVPNLGDFTKIGAEHGPVDLLVGGTPCQSFSVAGLRGGLADDRGNLALQFLRLAARVRARWVVWENVPGVLSSGEGRDFGSILGGLAELGYGFAYRVLDAQFFGVPQRRRRVFVVGYLGDWRPPAAVLFERASLSGDPPPSRTQREEVAGTLGGGPGNRGWSDDLDQAGAFIPEAAKCLTSGGGGNGSTQKPTPSFPSGGFFDVAHSLRAEGFDASEDGTGRGTPLVPVEPLTLAIRGRGDSHDLEWRQDGTANALLTPNGGRGGIGVGAVCAFSAKDHGADAGEIAPTLRAGGHSNSHANGGCMPAVQQSAQVRRLTPRECERLQGFPDDYTLTPYRGKPASDGPRYKALGNSMAVPCMKWIGQRIAAVSA